MSRPRSVVGASLVLALAMGACASRGAPRADGTAAPRMEERGEDGGGADRALWSDDLDQLDAELRQAQAQLEQASLGERPTEAEAMEADTKAGQVRPSPPPGPGRCERIAALAGRICQLRDRMCELATEHEGESRYSEACGRAGQTCEQAEQAADGCAVG